jgi:putative two-component system response regulator
MRAVRILAVDDQPFNLDLIEFVFMEIEGVSIVRALNGQEALDILEKDPAFHVILLDLSMPVMDGFETVKRLKANPIWKQIPTIIITANEEEKIHALGIGGDDFIGKPYDVQELKLRTFNYAKIKDYQDNLELIVQEKTAKLEEALLQAKRTEYEISARLGKASEYRDLETGMHIKRMSHYSAKLAELAGLNKEDVELILYASPLHDIGKVGIPDNILLKAGRLTPEEFQVMKLHSILGGKMLEADDSYPVLEAAQIIALQHHEKMDGTGYPAGLQGEDIHIFARIVTIADVFDALSSERVYKKAFSIEKTLEIMQDGSGSHFDSKLLELFIAHLEQFLVIKEKFKDEKEESSIMQLIDQLQ